MSDRVYVYGLVSGLSTVPRVPGHRLEIMRVAGLAVVIERMREAPVLSEATLRAQHAVVQRLARDARAIVPARFGSFVEPGDVEQLVRGRGKALRAALEHVREREQMTVRIFDATHGELTAAPASGSATGTAYLLARQAAARPRFTPAGRAIRAAVRLLVADERVDPPRGRVILTMHHLVRRGSARQYRGLVRRAASALPVAPRFTVSGPFAPFAFVPELNP